MSRSLHALEQAGGGAGRAAASLRAGLMTGRLAHAWLFYGPTGAGKREAAHALAAACLCAAGSERGDACGACADCRLTTAGTHPDLEHLACEQGKQVIGIDRVRAAIAELALAPVSAAGRVLIVEDADRLHPAAANAFLKTLEEPPAGAVIVLLTSRPDLLLSTIRSRCREVRFPPRAVDAAGGVDEALQAAACLLGADEAPAEPLARGDRAWALAGALAKRLGSESEGDAPTRGLERLAALRVLDAALAEVRAWLRAAALGGQPLGGPEAAALRLGEAVRQVEGNAALELVFQVLAADLATIHACGAMVVPGDLLHGVESPA
jgi:DNA polymerase III delta' subunit